MFLSVKPINKRIIRVLLKFQGTIDPLIPREISFGNCRYASEKGLKKWLPQYLRSGGKDNLGRGEEGIFPKSWVMDSGD